MKEFNNKKIQFNQLELNGPIYFPSISSVKSALPPIEYIHLLNALSELSGQYLVSAFDVHTAKDDMKPEMLSHINKTVEADRIVLLDSGNYESFWKAKQDYWSESLFHEVLSGTSCQLAFGYDNQEPPDSIEKNVRQIVEHYEKDTKAANGTEIIPIIHGQTDQIASLASTVAETTNVPMLAVPERRLGNSIYDRARTIAQIRESLNQTGRYVGLHLLGTGNPISLALFSISGADSFDGLEWCQTAVDHESALLHHFSQGEFFQQQTAWWEQDIPFQAKVLAHNLEFYNEWISRLHRSIDDRTELEFCRLNFPSRIFHQCSLALGWRSE